MLSTEAQTIINQAKNVLNSGTLEFSEGYCKGFSERCVETPWVASYIRGGEKILDIGYTMSSHDYLGLLIELRNNHNVEIDGVDIIQPERVKNRYPSEWLNQIMETPLTIGDIRKLDVPEGKYDLVTCISTIEHIGFDAPATATTNSAFSRAKTPEEVNMERDPQTNKAVLKKFHSALKKGGIALISVPVGQGGPTLLQDSLGYYCAQWEYDENSLKDFTQAEGFNVKELRFFKAASNGWEEAESAKDLSQLTSRLKPHAPGCAVIALEKI